MGLPTMLLNKLGKTIATEASDSRDEGLEKEKGSNLFHVPPIRGGGRLRP